MSQIPDPRVFFAAERTLLAWVRTCLAVMGLGFVVARFGFFLRLVAHSTDETQRHHLESEIIGVLLVFLGSAALGLAACQHARYCRSLPPLERPRLYWGGWSVGFASILAASGVLLAVYLLVRTATY